MSHTLLTLTFALGGLIACIPASPSETPAAIPGSGGRTGVAPQAGTRRPRAAPLVRAIVNPAGFGEEPHALEGYFWIDKAGRPALYLSSEHALMAMTHDAVFLEIEPELRASIDAMPLTEPMLAVAGGTIGIDTGPGGDFAASISPVTVFAHLPAPGTGARIVPPPFSEP